MNETNQGDDRFQQVKNLDREGDDHTMPALVNPLPAERPIGAQHVAVRRNTTAVLAQVKALAAAAGDAWYYRWPVKDGDSKKWIEGPSIKLANDLARIYGNCDVDVRVMEDAASWVFYARFMDLETGFSMTRPFQQRKSQKSIRGDSERQRDIAFQIGASKAIRNIVVNALQTYADYGMEEARNSLIEKIGKNLPGSRARLLEMIDERKIELSRIERAIGRTVPEMLAPDIARVLAMIKTIDDGMATVDETFPHETVANPLGAQPEPPTEARQEPAGEPSGTGSPRQRASRKGAQATAAQGQQEPADRFYRQTPEAQATDQGERADQAEKERQQAEEAKRDRLAEAEEEGREAAAARPTQARTNAQSATSRAAPSAPAVSMASQPSSTAGEGGFFNEALDYISKFTGSPGSLMDWWRNKRAQRGLLTMEQQTRVSHIYNAKINELGGLD